jgi:ferritin-like metal-binding protein YciE
MNEARQRIIRSLSEAHACELTLAQALQSQIDTAPRGSYRKGLQTHLRETRDHARRVEQRLGELRRRGNPVQLGIRLIENALGPFFAVGKLPLGLLGGSSGPEQLLDNAREACATEAVQIARYTAVERLAESSGDHETARLAASLRGDEQKLLDHVLDAIPSLTSWELDAELRGKAAAAITENGATGAARSSDKPRRKAATRAKRGAKARVPQSRAVARAAKRSARSKPASAAETGLPIANYQVLSADEIVPKLDALSQLDLARIESYEREHENRPPILSRVLSLRSGQTTPGYHETGVGEIKAAQRLDGADQAPRRPRFDGVHEQRQSDLDATDKELTRALHDRAREGASGVA